MDILNIKFIEALGWELLSQTDTFYNFKKTNSENIFFSYSLSSGICSNIYSLSDNIQTNYFLGNITTGQGLVDLLDSLPL